MNRPHASHGDQTPAITERASLPSGYRCRNSEVAVARRRSRPPSKQSTIEKLLKRKSGASMAQLMTPTGWQAHSVRAALSRLRKTGVAVVSAQNKKQIRVYRIDPEGSST